MPESIQRNRGRGQGYKFDRGGTPAEFGPFIGIVTNNVDPTRSGRLQVWIEQFGATNADGSPNLEDESTWRTVSYVPPWYGSTPHNGTNQGVGTFTGNQQSYGMWFTPPDLYTSVVCFFAGGDPSQGYYIGCVPNAGVTHMIPAIGASRKFQLDNTGQDTYFSKASQLPVTELNDENKEIFEDPRFFDKPKPVHSYLAGVFLQQGLIKDTTRGPITSNSQRESPSAAFGIATPGRAIYQGGLSEADIKNRLERGEIRPQQIEVIARRGGHTMVMDDGDLEGRDNLVRIRTAKGHQITMSDDGDCFYIIHANGQTWLEFGKQGTVDVFSTNSINLRTQGTLNMHADKDINMYAGTGINIKTKTALKIEADASVDIIGTGKMTLYSKNLIGIKSDGSLALKNTSSGSWDGGASINLKAGCINLNGGGAAPVSTPASIADLSLADTKFVQGQGWEVDYGALKTIVTRAPTHEPYPYHNQGVSAKTNLSPTPVTDLTKATAETLDKVKDVPVENPIDTSALLSQAPAEISVGSLDTTQVTALMAQQANLVDQPFDVVSPDKGIGKFGFSADQLESSGFLKPGTVQTFLQDPAQLESVLNSPAVWTGKSGVGNLGSLLADSNLQNITQNEIMVSVLNGLKTSGIVTGNEAPRDLAAFVQTASKFGVNNTVSWVKGLAPPDLVTAINTVAKSGQYAVEFVDRNASTVSVGTISVGGYTGTVERTDVDTAVAEVIDNDKVPLPNYGSGEFTEESLIETVTGGDPMTTVSEGYGPGVSEQTVAITRLQNEIYDLETVIAARQRRGQNTALQEAELARLQAELANLRTV